MATGHAAVRWLGNDTIELVQQGYLTKALIEQEYRELLALTRSCRVRWALSEADTVTGFETAIAGPGRAIVGHLKALGVERVLIIVPPGIVRLMARTLAFAVELPLKAVGTREEALDCLRRLQAGERVV